MSVHETAPVWRLNLTMSQKMPLLFLADVANQSTGLAWPKLETIARFAGCSERTVSNAVELALSRGWLVVVDKGGGPGKSTTYKFDLDALERDRELDPRNLAPGATLRKRNLAPHDNNLAPGSNNLAPDDNNSSPPTPPIKELTKINQEEPRVNGIVPEILDDIDLLLLDFYKLTGVRFPKKGHLKYIAPRLKEGRSIADLRLILLHKVMEWLGDKEFERYLTPESLYRPSKIDTKLSMAVAWDEKGRPFTGKNGATSAHTKEKLFQDLGFFDEEARTL